MNIDFVKVSPSQNMTVLITNYVPPKSYTHIAQSIMQYESIHAEQVGFIVAPKHSGAVLRLDMSGGEFCGNGVLAAAAYGHYKRLTSEHTFTLEASGVSEPLHCTVQPTSSHVYQAQAEMPRPLSIKELSITHSGSTLHGRVVEMDGISHFLIDVWLDKQDFPLVMEQIADQLDQPAIGIISYRKLAEGDYEMKPFVYVKTTGSQGFERSCGSGSLALGASLADLDKGNSFALRQPGGVIQVDIGDTYSISTTVKFTVEGFCFVE